MIKDNAKRENLFVDIVELIIGMYSNLKVSQNNKKILLEILN